MKARIYLEVIGGEPMPDACNIIVTAFPWSYPKTSPENKRYIVEVDIPETTEILPGLNMGETE